MFPMIHKIAFENEMQIRREIARLQPRDLTNAPIIPHPGKSLFTLLLPRPSCLPREGDYPCP